MRILVVGATGIIGRAVATALSGQGHDVVRVSSKSTPITVDMSDPRRAVIDPWA
jgi:uncharacterized protein YbjT (DUF2867 family)